jgi:hypothetical protein
VSSPHLPPEDARRDREFREYDEWVDPRQSGEMPFMRHLEEFRVVLQHSLAAVLAGMLVGWWLAPIVLADLIKHTVVHTVVMSPFEAFNERLKLAAILGAVVVLPYISWRLWSFVVPGLLHRERRWVGPSRRSCSSCSGRGPLTPTSCRSSSTCWRVSSPPAWSCRCG